MEAGIVVFVVIWFDMIRGKVMWSWDSYLHGAGFGLCCVIVGFYTDVWKWFIEWEVVHGGVWNLSDLFMSWEWNDLSFLQKVSPKWVTEVMGFCYFSGYLAMMVVPAVPCFLKGEFEQGWRYVLSGHLLQSLLIIPFLTVFSVQEIWWVKHVPDGLGRVFENDMAMLRTSYNCFPSMHTSVATAMAIVAMKEKSTIFRRVWITYCLLVILSTMYFPVHWLIDVMGGIVFGGVSAWVGSWLSKRLVMCVGKVGMVKKI